jgi:hypothetical protein
VYSQVGSGIRVILKITMSFGLLFTFFPLFQWYSQSKDILINLTMKCWYSSFNAHCSRLIWIVVQLRAVKIYPNVVLATSRKCVTHFETALCKFSHTNRAGLRANWHRNMLCFNGGLMLVSAGWKSPTTKHELPNLNLETYQPLKHVKFQQEA